MWRFQGESDYVRLSGVPVSGLTSGPVVVQFKPLDSWLTPSDQTVEILTGVTAVTTGTYVHLVPGTGALQVFITPLAAVQAGAEWRRVTTPAGPFLPSGFTELDVTTGTYAVEFRNPVTGWVAPSDQSVVIVAGELTTATANYTPVVTQLQVFIAPSTSTLTGNLWRVVGEIDYHPSGFVDNNVTSPSAVVEFLPVNGWVTPNDLTVGIVTGQLTTATATYTPLAAGKGAVRVTIAPAGAIAAGAQWRLEGSTTYYNSGDSVIGLSSGTATVEFKQPIIGWNAPAAQTVTVVIGQTAQVTGTYTAAPTGGLQITIEPAEAVAAGAQWRIVGATTFFSSGDIAVTTASTYAVEFKAIRDFKAPDNITGIVVVAGKVTSDTGTYVATGKHGAAGTYKISYKNCIVAPNTTDTAHVSGIVVTNAAEGTIKIQRYAPTAKLPKNTTTKLGTLWIHGSPNFDSLTQVGTGNIKSLSCTGTFIPTITANLDGIVKEGALDNTILDTFTSILPLATATEPRAATASLKLSLTGVTLDALDSPLAASIKISAKKVKGVTIPAGVSKGALIQVGNGLSLGVTNGDMLADLVESKGAIKGLSVKDGKLGEAVTSATLSTFLTPAAVAVVKNPSTVFVAGLGGTDAKADSMGKITGTTINGVFVAGADVIPTTLLIEPTAAGQIKAWKATTALGDAFEAAPVAKTEPAGIQTHPTQP
jgi:hypothetical protein